MSIPSHLHYTADHEWVLLDGDIATVGITQYAADALGDVVYLDLPEVGTAVTAAGVCGEIESTKSVSDLFAPLDGEVIEINQAIVDDASAVNLDPYGGGWLLKLRVGAASNLLSAQEYTELVEVN